MKIVVAKYPIGMPRSFDDFAQKQRVLVAEAADASAGIAVFPEYMSLELAATFDPAVRDDVRASLAALQAYREAWLALFSDLARRHRIRLAAGSFLLDSGGGKFRNRADLFGPDGAHTWQDKLQLTGFEKKIGVIEPGEALKVLDTGDMRIAVSICYDIEFPLPVRAQCEAGARLLLVPSCTDTAAGATRVEVGCLARALENRCFVAKAVTAGEATWSPMLDVNTGDAAVYAPMDVGLPADGVLARSAGDSVWTYADLDIAALDASREQAQVANDHDWPGQGRPSIVAARVERI